VFQMRGFYYGERWITWVLLSDFNAKWVLIVLPLILISSLISSLSWTGYFIRWIGFIDFFILRRLGFSLNRFNSAVESYMECYDFIGVFYLISLNVFHWTSFEAYSSVSVWQVRTHPYFSIANILVRLSLAYFPRFLKSK
jgi:hypothetical protein